MIDIDVNVNHVLLSYFDSLKINRINKLNSTMFSSVDYITMNQDEYANNPELVYYIYYNLIPMSLKFDLIIPLNTLSTNFSINTNDIKRKIQRNQLIYKMFEPFEN